MKSRIAAPGVGYLRVAEFGKSTADQIKSEIASVTKAGAKSVIIDLRGTAFGDVDAGLAAARLFVKSGVLVYRQDRGKEKEAVSAAAGDGAITRQHGAADRQRHVERRRSVRGRARRQQARAS